MYFDRVRYCHWIKNGSEKNFILRKERDRVNPCNEWGGREQKYGYTCALLAHFLSDIPRSLKNASRSRIEGKIPTLQRSHLQHRIEPTFTTARIESLNELNQ